MLDKDKLFLIINFGGQHRSKDQVLHGMNQLYESIKKTLDDSIKVYVIPQATNDEVKFEFLNVKDCTDDYIKELTNKLDNIINEFKRSL